MSKLLARLAGYLSNRTLVGVDKVGNRYFTRTEEIDGIMKEKRWVVFKGEEDPTSLPEKENLWGRKQKNRPKQTRTPVHTMKQQHQQFKKLWRDFSVKRVLTF